MDTTTPVTAISITNVLKKAGLMKADHYTNGRIGYASQSEGFTVTALDQEYIPVYGLRNGKVSKIPTSWKVRNAKNTRFSVGYYGATSSRYASVSTSDALKIAFDALSALGYVVAYEGRGLVVTGKEAS
jgi:hypothetical protein